MARKRAPPEVVPSTTEVHPQPTKEPTVADQNDALPSIIEYSQDIADAPPPEPLPKGTYPSVIKGASRKASKSSANYYFELLCEIAPEDYPPTYPVENDPDGKVLPYRRVTAMDNARGRFAARRLCETLGVTPTRRLDPNDWHGLRVMVTVDHEQDPDGIMREVITKLSSI